MVGFIVLLLHIASTPSIFTTAFITTNSFQTSLQYLNQNTADYKRTALVTAFFRQPKLFERKKNLLHNRHPKKRKKDSNKLYVNKNGISASKSDYSDTLIPKANPYYANSTVDVKSKLPPYTPLRPVLDGLNILYPPTDLEKRNAISRTDGYWTYINNGDEPPLEYTYGEFDFYFFADLLDKANDYYNRYNACERMNDEYHEEDELSKKTWKGKTFCDIGSGTGRLVLAAAALHPDWKLCKGVEILDGIHQTALENLKRCQNTSQHNNYDDSFVIKKERGKSLSLQRSQYNNPSDVTNGLDGDFISDIFSTLSSFDNNQNFYIENNHDENCVDQVVLIDKSEDEDEDEDDEDEDEIAQNFDTEGKNQSTSGIINVVGFDENDDDINNNDEYILPTSQINPTEYIPLAPIQFIKGSFMDPYLHLSDIDLAFIFSSCMSSSILKSLSQALGRQCRPGSIIITTDYPLILQGTCEPEDDDSSMPSGSYEFEIIDKIDGYCWLVGGITTAYIHVVKQSLWNDYGEKKRVKPEIPLEEQALRIVKAMENGTLTDTKKFMKGVYNNMMFLGFPTKWTAPLREFFEN